MAKIDLFNKNTWIYSEQDNINKLSGAIGQKIGELRRIRQEIVPPSKENYEYDIASSLPEIVQKQFGLSFKEPNHQDFIDVTDKVISFWHQNNSGESRKNAIPIAIEMLTKIKSYFDAYYADGIKDVCEVQVTGNEAWNHYIKYRKAYDTSVDEHRAVTKKMEAALRALNSDDNDNDDDDGPYSC